MEPAHEKEMEELTKPEPVIAVVVAHPVTISAEPALAWSDDLCNCCSDCSTCCATYWCMPIVASQLYEKVKGRPGTCAKLAALLFLLGFIGAFVRGFAKEAIVAHQRDQEQLSIYEHEPPPLFWGGVTTLGSLISFAGLVITIALIASIRQTIRAKDQIRPGCCGGADDCCVATFCQCCAVSQMMRHVLTKWMGRTPASYQLCSPTGYVAV